QGLFSGGGDVSLRRKPTIHGHRYPEGQKCLRPRPRWRPLYAAGCRRGRTPNAIIRMIRVTGMVQRITRAPPPRLTSSRVAMARLAFALRSFHFCPFGLYSRGPWFFPRGGLSLAFRSSGLFRFSGLWPFDWLGNLSTIIEFGRLGRDRRRFWSLLCW